MIEAKTTNFDARIRTVREFWPRISDRAGAVGAVVRSIARGDLKPKRAASYLGISVKTLTGHADDGEIRYINVARGKKNKRRMYAIADLEEFRERRSRRDVPCQSKNIKKARSTISTSSSKAVGFMALQDARARERQKLSSGQSATKRNSKPR